MSKKKKSSAGVKRYPVEQFFSLRSITGFSLSPDDKTIYFITNTTGMPQVWSVPFEGGWANQVTMWDSSVKGLQAVPKSDDILFLSDNDGDEQNQVYKVSTKDGGVTYETAGFEDSQCSFTNFTKKGDTYGFGTNKKLQYNFESYLRNVKTGENTLIKSYEDQYPTLIEGLSSNGRYASFLRFYGNINQDIILHDLRNNTETNVTEHDISEDNFNALTHFTNDNKGFYYVTDEGSDFKGIKHYNIKSGKSEWFIREKWDITGYSISDDEKMMVYTVNKYGSNEPHLINLKTRKKIKLKLRRGNYTNVRFTRNGKFLVYTMDSPVNPSDIFVYDIKKHKNRQVTNSLVGGITREAFTEPKDVVYESFDGLKIHALFYVPKGVKKDGSNPAIVWPHGGPEHQETHNFSKYIQVMTNAGFIVIAPNFRGSTGYGKAFQKLIYKDWGGNEFKDVLASVDYLKNSGYVDPKKIAMVGGSFGGFMTLTSVTKAPDIWRCAVDIFGPSNLHTFLRSIPEHWKEGAYRLVGNPDTDTAILDERSPINYVDNIKCPVLVIQGKHDPRVVEEESVQIVNKLKDAGKEVEYLLLDDEGHGFTKVANAVKVFKKKLEFLEKHLR
jgi:dipeptidyl aminopeptidase/acylaminoacyl peptidase